MNGDRYPMKERVDQLVNFATLRFTNHEFREFADRVHGDAVASFAERQPSIDTDVRELADRGLITRAFMDALAARFPRRGREVAQLRALWTFDDPPSSDAQLDGRSLAAVTNAADAVGLDTVGLTALNRSQPLADGSSPMRTWLRNAIRSARGSPAESVFLAALRQADARSVSDLGDDAMATSRALASWDDEEIAIVGQVRARPGAGAPGGSAALVRQATTDGKLDGLIASALGLRAEADLVAVAQTRGLLPTVPNALERAVKERSRLVLAHSLLTGLFELLSRVCQVQLQRDGKYDAEGTGFLVGPDLVMTNQHVIAPLLAGEATGLRVSFDLFRDKGSRPVDFEPVAGPRDAWLVLESPPSPLDEIVNTEGHEPAADHLDVAIIRLARAAGRLPVGSDDAIAQGRERGWLSLSRSSARFLLAEGTDVIILQHPQGAAMQIGFGNVLALLPQRVRYDTRTENGSSGSPCFDVNLELVALHHAGDPRYPMLKRNEYNQGIPIYRIAELCAKRAIHLPLYAP